MILLTNSVALATANSWEIWSCISCLRDLEAGAGAALEEEPKSAMVIFVVLEYSGEFEPAQ